MTPARPAPTDRSRAARPRNRLPGARKRAGSVCRGAMYGGLVIINDTSYNNVYVNAAGCDSMVMETIQFYPSDTVINYSLTCSPADTGTIIQHYSNMLGCDSMLVTITSLAPEDTCNIPVITKDVFIPDVFSPNDDGYNDLFLVSTRLAAVSEISFLRIYDRWGGLVAEHHDFPPNDPVYGWDGTEKGKLANPGVYIWIVSILFTDGTIETRTGDVTLIR